MRRLFSTFAALAISLLAPSKAAAVFGDNSSDFGIGAQAGFPSLIGPELQYTGIPGFHFRLGYGFAPIDAYLRNAKPISAVPLNLGVSDQYSLQPVPSYSLTSFNIGARWFPSGSGFFAQLEYHRLRAAAAISADVKNETAGTSAAGLVTGQVQLTQPMIGPGAGYQFNIGSLYLDFSLGLAVLLKANFESSVGGSLSSLLPLVPDAEASFEQAKVDLKTQVENAVNSFRDQIKVSPVIGVGLGFSF